MPVNYPASLPPPSRFAFKARERRASPSIDGPLQVRARSRDATVEAVGVKWRVNPAELATWLSWYETDLLWGQRRFIARFPGYLGNQLRSARFVSQVNREHIGRGNYELSADLEIRGLTGTLTNGGVALPIGWLSAIGSASGTAAHANSGSSYFSHPNPALRISTTVYAGVVGYSAETVAWSSAWAPVASDASPTLTVISGGVVSVNWQPSGSIVRGMLTLTATIGGVAVATGQRLVMTCDPALNPSFSFYNPVAWGPEP